MILQTLTPSEEEIMQLIWKEGQMYFRDLMSAFPEPKPHQNTVSTFLKILVEKHYLNTEKQGRINLYSPAVALLDYRKFVLKNFLENYYEGSAPELLKMMIEENLLNGQDFSQLFEVKTTLVPLMEHEDKEDPVKELVKELTGSKKDKKKHQDKKKKKKK